MQEERKVAKIAFPEFEVRDSLELSRKLASVMKSFENKGSSYLHFKNSIPVYGGTNNFGEASTDVTSTLKGTVFSNEGSFVVQGNSDKSFKISSSIVYSSLKVNSELVTNHKGTKAPEIDASKDTESSENSHVIEYPFYFYLVDIRNKVVLVAGKIVDLGTSDFSNDGQN